MLLIQWKLQTDILSQDHCAWWKGLLQLLCHVLPPSWAPGQVLPDTLPEKSIYLIKSVDGDNELDCSNML